VVLNPPPAANPPVELSAEFGPDPGAPAAARRLVVDALRGRDRGDRLLADAQLVVSELVTNAVVHAKSVFAVGIRREDSALRISVRDGNPLPPTVRDAGPAAGFGRGMRLIDTLSSGWGVDPADGGKVVWAELRI
jgi:anti-sigma regulatory factor (Ser/Thr protein kinase)